MTTPQKSSNTVWHHPSITRKLRAKLNDHPSMVLWFTGLSGSGKSSLAHAVEDALYQRACRTFVLDGDNVRHGLNGDLGFSADDRTENIRRIGEVAKLFVESGVIVLTAFISPFRADRAKARYVVGSADFVEIYCQCSLEICEQRDVKGLYKRARAGEIKDFTGISSPYEEPEDAELVVDTGTLTIEQSVQQVLDYLIAERGL